MLRVNQLIGFGARRISAAAPAWSPLDLGTSVLLAWYKGDTLAGSDTDPIATWPDSSGNARDATQVTSGSRPTLAAAYVNSKNAVKFDGTVGQYFDLPDVFSGQSSGSIYMVLKKNADPAASDALSGIHRFGTSTGNGSTGHWPFTDGSVYLEFGTTARKAGFNFTPSFASWRIASISSAANDYDTFIDGTAGYDDTSNTVGFDSAPKVGRSVRNPASPSYRWMDGHKAEILLIAGVLSQANREKVEGFLAHKWGLAANLDAGHPYKAGPP